MTLHSYTQICGECSLIIKFNHSYSLIMCKSMHVINESIFYFGGIFQVVDVEYTQVRFFNYDVWK